MSSKDRGFTLLEIVVSLAVIGLIMGVVAGQMGDVFDRDLKKASTQLSSTIRYLYNKSATEGIYIRLVLDIDERSYWVEATSDPVSVSRGEEKGKKAAAKDEKKDEAKTAGSDAAKDTTGTGDEASEGVLKPGEIEKLKPKEATFSPVDEFLLKPTRLPDGAYFKDIQVEHKQSPVEGGKESVYFFPNGYVERAIINLRDEDDEVHYSLETNPISGRVSIEDKYRRMGE